MFSGPRLRKVAYSLILVGVALLLYFRHQEVEERGSLHWFDRPVVLIVTPIAKGIVAVRERIGTIVHRYFFLVGLERENERLRSEIDQYRGKEIFVREMEKENERLRRLLDLQSQRPGEWMAARVVSYPPISPYQVLTINRGSRDGIRRRAPVVAFDGLVGQVSRVFGNYSQVLLITDPTSAVDGRIENTDSRGLVVGKAMKLTLKRDLFIGSFEYLNQSTVIDDGAHVVTSGLDGVFPPGIPVGAVHGSKRKKYDIFQQAEVLPAVDFNRLREVIVLKEETPQ